MEQRQIDLSDMPVEANRAFLESLHSGDGFVNSQRWFDKKNDLVTRKRDKNMTLAGFLGIMSDSGVVKLQLGSPFEDSIRYCAICQSEEGVSRFAWMECPYNEHNYRVVSELLEGAYSKVI